MNSFQEITLMKISDGPKNILPVKAHIQWKNMHSILSNISSYYSTLLFSTSSVIWDIYFTSICHPNFMQLDCLKIFLLKVDIRLPF